MLPLPTGAPAPSFRPARLVAALTLAVGLQGAALATPATDIAELKKSLAAMKSDYDKRIGSLWSLANIATLVGLLGTVLGLIHTFGAVSAPGLSAADRQRILANGIAEAMYNTAMGLGIAVVCMIAHLILHQRSKNIQHDLDATQERVFNLLTIQTRPGGF